SFALLFLFTDPAPSEIYTLSLHDALPILEYTDEYVAGFQHEFRDGVVFGVRYIDRRLKRVIEDQGGISVEQFNALANNGGGLNRSEEHTSELQSRGHLVCRLLLEKKKKSK